MTKLPCCCSNCGAPMTYQAGKIPDRPLCDKCLSLQEVRERVNCEKCPIRKQCEEVDRRGL